MKIKIPAIFFACFFIISFDAFAQKPDSLKPHFDSIQWRVKMNTGFLFNQASFNSRWTGGGVNSLGLGTFFYYTAKYKKGKNTWDTNIEFLYGFTDTEGIGFRKANDRLFIDSKYGHNLTEKWSLFTAVNFQTQFAKGFEYGEDPNTGDETETLISKFMAPGYITTSFGIEYTPTDYFFIRFSPISPRWTVVSDKDLYLTAGTNYGVPIGETVRTEWVAAQLIADFKKDIFENVNLQWRYAAYWNMKNPLRETDHRLDIILSAKVNNWLATSLSTNMLYDVDQIDGLQIAQAFNLGVTYKFQNYRKKE
ncbi:DUF3078 domain-containing protein [Marinigracilibium pacificum]|uniref:DUF3078 domain-containing protein n=1 Tax=Marinigracilibium pacificum TaxID=2729599 RepID=A0A848J075_9BACT|nr:DUF3078 domain-containing protein [Marinigracilibium pacificum]NMM50193.1 DUF3078 domain-containing protein [Marinigracilibium pacificum]